jgi:hypothetical protein
MGMFILGLFVGALLGYLAAALMWAGRDRDDEA